jgi:prepilin-type N-terminal cleavage/methylation domain-containing protein
MKKHNKQSGFTLIEILVVIGIIAILAAVVIIAINPARQFAQARNTQRTSNVNAILNAVWQRMVDNRGVWNTACDNGDAADGGAATVTLPGTATEIGRDSAGGNIDLEECIVPTYISTMVMDPSTGTANDTGYRVMQAAGAGRVTIDVIAPELSETISVTR